MSDPYALLGVGFDASTEEIEAAFRKRAAATHPDVVAHLGPDAVATATEEMADLEAARHLLADPLRRAAHDARRPAQPQRERAPRAPSAPRGPIGPLQRRAGIRGTPWGGAEIFVGRGHRAPEGLLSTPNVAGAVLQWAILGPRDIADLAANTSLRTINLESTFVGDDEVELLCHLPRLRRLDLDNTRITDRSCAALARMPGLDDLALNDTEVTDAGVAALGRSRALHSLQLRMTSVTSAGLAHLDEVPLRTLSLPRGIGKSERRRLEQVHPGLMLL